MLTTIDNPFNPFDDFINWYLYDIEKDYNSCSYLARIANTSEDYSEKENNDIIEQAIDDIIKYDFLGIRTKVSRDMSYGAVTA